MADLLPLSEITEPDKIAFMLRLKNPTTIVLFPISVEMRGILHFDVGIPQILETFSCILMPTDYMIPG
jgi:hypothetical protein